MHRFTCLGLLLVAIAPTYLWAAPVPERKSAKPAVIKAGTEQFVLGVQQTILDCAHIAILRDKKASELAIVRRYLRDSKDTKELYPWLKKNFVVERVPDAKLIRISFRDGTPEEQAAIINTVVDYYLRGEVGSMRNSLMREIESRRQSLERNQARGRFTAEQLTKAKDILKEVEERVPALPALVEKAKAR